MTASEILTSRSVNFSYLLQRARQPGLFIILDPTDNPQVLKFASDADIRVSPLFHDPHDTIDQSITPLLVELNPRSMGQLRRTIGNSSWGILIESSTDLHTLVSHLRHFLLVEAPDRETLFFRYYDPNVLPTFLSACTDRELTRFFGPMEAILCGDDRGDRFERFHLQHQIALSVTGRLSLLFPLRDAHLEAFSAVTDRILAEDIRLALLAETPILGTVIERAALERLIRIGMRTARGYGFENSDDIAAFTALMIELGEGFDAYPKIMSIFDRRSESPELRLDRLFEEMSDEDWESVETRDLNSFVAMELAHDEETGTE